MNKINFSYASKVEHNFAQRVLIKTIEKFSGKKKLENLYKSYSLDSKDPNTFWTDILNLMDIKVIDKSKSNCLYQKVVRFYLLQSSFRNH